MTDAATRPKLRTGPGFKAPSFDDWGIKVMPLKLKPFNYGFTSDVVRETAKAVQLDYYKWRLWIPKSCVRRVNGQLFGSIDAINRAKDHDSAEIVA
jgi:hypothetical protein